MGIKQGRLFSPAKPACNYVNCVDNKTTGLQKVTSFSFLAKSEGFVKIQARKIAWKSIRYRKAGDDSFAEQKRPSHPVALFFKFRARTPVLPFPYFRYFRFVLSSVTLSFLRSRMYASASSSNAKRES